MALAGKVAAVYVSDVTAVPVTFTDQATTKDAQNKRYQITNAAYRYWAPTSPITVKKNGSVITSGFILEYAGGYVVFDSPLQGTDTVTVSGQALTMVQCGGFFNWSVDLKAETKEVTDFNSSGWKQFIQTVDGWSGKAEAYWGDDRFFKSLGQLVAVKLYIDSGASQRCLEGYAIITGEGIEAKTDDVVQDKIDFEGVGQIYVRI